MKTVIRPARYFGPKLLPTHSDKDLWPQHWTVHDEERIPLKDVTFTIPVSWDHPDRVQNLGLSVCILQKHFDTNIIVGENVPTSVSGQPMFSNFSQWTNYVQFHHQFFHRTRMLNDMARMAATPIVVNYDADVLLAPMQILEAVRLIRDNKADFVYPYDGRFARVPRHPWFRKLEQSLDVGIFGNITFQGMRPTDPELTGNKSVGGCIIVSKEKFFEAGGENENMISFAPEDYERNWRFKKLCYRVKRVNGVLWHIDHHTGPNSNTTHPHFQSNQAEYEKIKQMGLNELRAYVATWPSSN